VKAALDTVRSEMNRAGQNAPEIGDPLWIQVSRHFHVEADALVVPHQRRRPNQKL
jgi:hypothetical protein